MNKEIYSFLSSLFMPYKKLHLGLFSCCRTKFAKRIIGRELILAVFVFVISPFNLNSHKYKIHSFYCASFCITTWLCRYLYTSYVIYYTLVLFIIHSEFTNPPICSIQTKNF